MASRSDRSPRSPPEKNASPQRTKGRSHGQLQPAFLFVNGVWWDRFGTIVTTIGVAAAIVASAIGGIWWLSSGMTDMRSSVLALRNDLTVYTAQQIGDLNRRVTVLETNSAAASEKQAETASAIAVLQSQTSEIQDTLNDIKSTVGQIAHTTNAPIRR